MTETQTWTGKTAVVTGAGGGIGSAIARMLARKGLRLVLVGRSENNLKETEKACRACGAEALLCIGDVKDLAFAKTVPAAAAEAFGGLDLLVNCAGMAQHAAYEDVTPEEYDEIMSINARAPFFLCQQALPYLKASPCGTIINVASVVAHKGYAMQSVYAESKHALLGLSKALAGEVYGEGVRVHVISPGAVYTPMVALARPDLTPEGMPKPEDVAAAAEFLLNMRFTDAVIDELELHRSNKTPFA